jgi:copper chaperone CopZ
MRKLIIVLFSILTVNAWAQKETVNILTSAPCVGMLCCKEKIEEEMQFTRGVTAVDLEIETGIVTVTFKTKKTDTDKLKKVISLLGYNADDIKANEQAHDKLPSCCQHLDFEDEK